ncbi:hypothetical protein L914_20760, partial [Phytophthora nicotianae]
FNAHVQEKADKTEKEKRDAETREAATAEVVRDALVGLYRTRSSSPEYEQQTTTPPQNDPSNLTPTAVPTILKERLLSEKLE